MKWWIGGYISNMTQPCKPMMIMNQINDWEIGDAEFAYYWVYLYHIHADLWSFYLHNIHRWWISMASGPVIRSRIEDWASAMQNGKTAYIHVYSPNSLPGVLDDFSRAMQGLPAPKSVGRAHFRDPNPNCRTRGPVAKPLKHNKFNVFVARHAPNATYIMLFVA